MSTNTPVDPAQPMVSVITAVYNRVHVLERCIRSVAAQPYPNLEHIVVDGGSTDGTLDIIRRNEGRLGAWLSEPDHGVYDAWNKGLAMARGEWIAFLGSDDEYLPGAIPQYVAAAQANPAAEYISSRVAFVYPTGQSRVIGAPWDWQTYRRRMCVAHVGSFHRRTIFERLGRYNPEYTIVGDYELLLRAGESLRAHFLDAITARMDAGGLSDGRAALQQARLVKLRSGTRSRAGVTFDYAVAVAKSQCRRQLLQALAP